MTFRSVSPLTVFDYPESGAASIPVSAATPSLETSYNVYEVATNKHDDYIVRLTGQARTNTLGVSIFPTEYLQAAVSARLFEKDEDIAFLQDVTSWLKKRLDYQHAYNAYSMDMMSDEDFERVSRDFMVSPVDLDVTSIRDVLEKFHRLVRFQVSDTEISEYLRIGEELLEVAKLEPQTVLSAPDSTV